MNGTTTFVTQGSVPWPTVTSTLARESLYVF